MADSRAPQLQALGRMLRSCRSRLSPADVGLPPGHNRRRTPGLRREEVAELAGVSVTWYTWLEQGRDIRATASILDCVGRALRMSADEYAHMMDLAGFPARTNRPAETERSVPARWRLILAGMSHPALIVDERADVLVWNAAACALFADFGALPEAERNMIWQWFANPDLRERIANWEERSPYAVALFRSLFDRNAGDPWFPRFVEKLAAASPYFRERWSRHEVRRKSGGELEFVPSGAEAAQRLETTSFRNVDGREGVHLFVFTPEDTD
ncbi:helix-turn-helix transcriptional regulator [Cohnella zeiphila]|uniref:Helix-turn-helix domain-containing protein n=1 Tax=Cohnella zeiphila TaxID=2761120 RepID=A0A7X0VXA0_9BACL|nr:helix-turn-helix transcriptional regulator [Cohnella zeiphila]MBB6733806.1 helix-turn-helix domain-containing protein [Cohnella zeiphila]